MFLLFINDTRTTYSHLQFFYLQMTAYYIERSNIKQTRNYYGKICTTYSDWNLTGKWSFILVNASFYVLPTNVSSTSYDMQGHTLALGDSAKYLGVTINKIINWNTHIESITKKVNSTRAFIQRNLQHCS
jgi:hypothetical protein